MLQLPILADHGRTVNLAQSVTPYAFPSRTLWAFNRCTVKGELTGDGLGTLISTPGTSGSEAAGTSVVVVGSGWVVDEHVGKFILWVTGALAGRFGVVYSNDADTLMVTTQNTSYTAPAPGDTFELMVHGTSIEYDGGTVDNGQANASTYNMRWENISFNCTSTVFSTLAIASIARINFRLCSFGQNISSINCADGARMRMQTCYVDVLGQTFAEWGLLNCGSNGSVELFQGTVIDGRFSASVNPAQCGVTCKGASSPQWQGELVIRGLGTMGYNMEGCIAGTNDNAGTMNLIRFIDCQRGFIINGDTEEGGGYYGLPDLHGNITGDYVVTAQHHAQVVIAGGTATSAVGLLAVSATNGSAPSSYAEDRTLISGGSPSEGQATDPGDGNAIPTTLQGSVPLSIGAGAETNTLAAPTRSSQELALVSDIAGGGTREVTFSSAMNTTGNTIATFSAVGQFLQLRGTVVGGSLVWRVIANDGVTLS
jgi:hypothetical protein